MTIRWQTQLRTASLAALISLAVGCRSFNMPSLPILEDLSLLPDDPVPADVLSRYGPEPSARLAGIEQLGRRAQDAAPAEQQRIAEALASQIHVEKDPVVREKIIRAISSSPVPLASAVLRAGLGDQDLDVRLAACEAWGRRDDPQSVAVLRQVLEANSEDVDLRLAAVAALGNIKRPESADALSLAIGPDQDPALQYQAVAALENVTGLDHGEDVTAWRDYFTRRAAYAAGGGPPPQPQQRSLVERTLFWWR